MGRMAWERKGGNGKGRMEMGKAVGRWNGMNE